MFSEQTERTLGMNFPLEAGLPGMVVMPAEVYRELVFAARQWDALRAVPASRGATLALVPQQDGSLRIEPR